MRSERPCRTREADAQREEKEDREQFHDCSLEEWREGGTPPIVLTFYTALWKGYIAEILAQDIGAWIALLDMQNNVKERKGSNYNFPIVIWTIPRRADLWNSQRWRERDISAMWSDRLCLACYGTGHRWMTRREVLAVIPTLKSNRGRVGREERLGNDLRQSGGFATTR
jgi:hypothetical protein